MEYALESISKLNSVSQPHLAPHLAGRASQGCPHLARLKTTPQIAHLTSPSQQLADLATPLAGHAGTVVGILAPGPSASASVVAPTAVEVAAGKDAMAVDTDTPATTTASAPAQSEAAKKKEAEALAERQRKYPGPARSGVVLAAEKKVTSKLLDKEQGSSEKIFMVNE